MLRLLLSFGVPGAKVKAGGVQAPEACAWGRRKCLVTRCVWHGGSHRHARQLLRFSSLRCVQCALTVLCVPFVYYQAAGGVLNLFCNARTTVGRP